MMNRKAVISCLAAAGGLAIAACLVVFRPPASVEASGPPTEIHLRTNVRDFRSDHPDFGIVDVARMGHCAHHLAATLPDDRRPVAEPAGQAVSEQWYDKHGHPIMPYLPEADDAGLPGGHFDVDVFDAPTKSKRYHKHEFDDAFDVTYIDIAQDPNLLFRDIIPVGYPNDLRVEFFNAHHGVGTFVFEAGAPPVTGAAQDGFEAIFDPDEMVQLKVDFTSLNDMRHTAPGKVQSDVVNRDDSFAVRMYDIVTGALVYEIAAYHHGDAADIEHGATGGTYESEDACGQAIVDDIGEYDGACDGAITSAETFQQWFRDVLGTNLSKGETITLTRSPLDGVYEYLTDEFFPIDGELLGNEGSPHNHFFTLSFRATFTYDACAGQFFEFEGNDDAWVYIDDGLVLDIGGVATPAGQYIALDRLELVDGVEYSLAFFYANRRETGHSTFKLRTNLLLQTGVVMASSSYD